MACAVGLTGCANHPPAHAGTESASLENTMSFAVPHDFRRSAVPVTEMLNPYDPPASHDNSKTSGTRFATARLADTPAVAFCVISGLATLCVVWFALQRVYNTIDPVYERVSLLVSIAFGAVSLVRAILGHVTILPRPCPSFLRPTANLLVAMLAAGSIAVACCATLTLR